MSQNQRKYTFLQNRNNISVTIIKYFSKSCKNIIGFDIADRSTCTDVKFSNWTIVPLSVQTAGEILVSYWSPARQDFRLPFWLTNHVSAGQNCREIVQFQDFSLFNSWSDHISKYNTPQFCSILETCFCQTQPWWFSPVCVQPISDATAWPQLRLLHSSAVLDTTLWPTSCLLSASRSPAFSSTLSPNKTSFNLVTKFKQMLLLAESCHCLSLISIKLWPLTEPPGPCLFIW